MGCSGSKEEDLPLVVLCRERRELIRAAANHRYALAAAHVSYFRSLKDVGDALRKFVDEELITASPSSSSSFSSPSLILPPNFKRKKNGNAEEEESSSLHLHDDGDEEDSHLHLSDSSSSSASEEAEDSLNYNHHRNGRRVNHHRSEDDDTHHQRRNNRRRGHVQQKGKISDGDTSSHLHHNQEDGSSSFNHYPPPEYGNSFGGGFGSFANDPYGNPNPYPHPHPHSYGGGPYVDQWAPQGGAPAQPWFFSGGTSSNPNVYYMKKSAPVSRTVVHEAQAEPVYGYSDSYWTSPPGYGNAGYNGNFGYPSMGSPVGMGANEGAKVKAAPPPPPSPKASVWDFFNPFDGLDNGHSGLYSGVKYGYGSNPSSPDSSEVREREGIPDLEEETESEVYKEVPSRTRVNVKKGSGEMSPRSRVHKNGEGSSRSGAPLHKNKGKSRAVPKSESSSRSLPSWSSVESEKQPSVPHQQNGESSKKPYFPSPQYNAESEKPSISSWYSDKPSTSPPHSKGKSWVDQTSDREMAGSISLADEKSSQEDIKSVDEGSVKKKGVSFEVEGTSKQDDSSKLSDITILPPHGTRDLREVVAEIKDEFETASGYGKEVAMMLEVGKLPYQPSFLKVLLSRILYLINPSLSLPDPPSTQSVKLASSTVKLARSYFEDVGKDVDSKACNLSSTLDKLYAWEKKLYKEVKDEERLRVLYEKQCKRLKTLDEEGAETGKIDATRAAIRRLLTKLDVSIKAIDAISSRIQKLRDDELQPQVAVLIHGLIRMWKAMLKCHKKQFQAVMESKMRKLKANTGLQTDSSSRATNELERELRAWSNRFNDWITSQKSYVESLNGWLLQCLQYEPEETPDGTIPYSPGRIGAPPIFVICHDWNQAMEAISEARVANAMNTFATSLRQLWEKQDEEGRQRLKAEYLTKDYERQLRAHRMERGKKSDREPDAATSDKGGLSVVQSDSGVSPLDDLKVDLDSMRQRLAEERTKHKDAMKLVHDAASSSLQGGLVPIFKALESFTSEALKVHEHVRLEHPGERTQ